MKKIALLMALLLLVFGLCACTGETTDQTAPSDTVSGDPTVEETPGAVADDEHRYVEEILVEPDCTTNGSKRLKCEDCDKEYTEEIPALGHEGTGASCTEPSVCTRCGEVAEDAWGHVDENGVCKNCGINMSEAGDVPSAAPEVTVPAEDEDEELPEETEATTEAAE